MKFKDPVVKSVFDNYPSSIKEKLFALRQLIFDVAESADGVGELTETLRWGDPSYLTNQTKSGSIIRINSIKPSETDYAIYFHCQTQLVSTFRQLYPGKFNFIGNRCMRFKQDDVVSVKELKHCIELALTYNLNKKW